MNHALALLAFILGGTFGIVLAGLLAAASHDDDHHGRG